MLQRRLASSPEAIHRSLVRRSERLEQRRRGLVNGGSRLSSPRLDLDLLEGDGYSAEGIETIEDELLDTATAARTVEELNAELTDLAGLLRTARAVGDSGRDRKWTELSRILQDRSLTVDGQGRQRKFIVFTEHRDTLGYLADRIRALPGRERSVRTIHGGVGRRERREITEEFTHDPDCHILIATDAAGEGLNLQAAHLMVNYDLPWNPNRIEQRFGRIHRIGQTQVCRLWNLVAANTREGLVFTRLLDKIEEQSRAYGGKVFDVLGESFSGTPLRELLTDAIRYGERPENRAWTRQVIDASVGDGLGELLRERSLASDRLPDSELRALRASMDEARARRLQPHYIETAFIAAFTRLGGRIVHRDQGHYEITQVPTAVRATGRRNIASRYFRVTFSPGHARPEGRERAELLAPGHPLHDAVMQETIRRYGGALMVEHELPKGTPFHARETKEVERRGVEAVLAAERALGRTPHEQAFNNPGYDILSTGADGETVRIEVKARVEGARDFLVTHNEVLTGRNAAPRYRLALVEVHARGLEYHEVRYVADPFATTDLGGFEDTGVSGGWKRTWVKGRKPF